MNTKNTTKTPLTEFDTENWWDFLINEYPENYHAAYLYYHDNDDPDLEAEGCCPRNFDINDYFYICILPRISAVGGIIRVDGKEVKRYGGFDKWARKRLEFEKLKETSLFKSWKYEQFGCQDFECAWCKRRISPKYAQVDHVNPLFYDGTNNLNNLVLTCRKCNCQKSIKPTGYNDFMNDHYKNAVPRWIKPNSYNNRRIPYFNISDYEIEKYKNGK